MCREDRAWDCALGLTATGMQREVGTAAVAHSASHFRANGSWHRMLWPENLTAQECCARVSFSSARLTSQAGQNSVYSPCRLQAPPGGGHTLPHSLAHWIPYNPHDAPESHDTPLGARVFSVPDQSGFSDFLYLCLTHACLTVRAGGQNTLWDTHLSHSLQRHPSVHTSSSLLHPKGSA